MPAQDKKYVITFYATLKGNKALVSNLRKIEQRTKRFSVTTKKATKATQTYGQALMKISKRALVTIPIWLLLRSAMMTVLRTISDMVRANLELEDGLARIRTVMHGTTGSIDAEMQAIKGRILDTATRSSLSLKELSEAFYYLKTASLTAEEATSAFKSTTDAMIGTGVNAKEMARAVAGIYNTMGKYILQGASAQEKFQKIADVLTYTYATQDVEMKELIEGYTKLAPYLTGLEDSFTDLVTIIGFLNTRMLRAGRTGRLTGRAILQITKNASKLASIFGMTFDPDKPINLLEILETINDRMDKQGKLTFKQGQALQQVFATRGGVAIRLLIESFDELKESIEKAGDGVGNFAEKMKEIRLMTITSQMKRMKNLFAVLMNDFVSGVYATGDLAEALDKINNSLAGMRPGIEATGQAFGWFFQEFAKGINILSIWGNMAGKYIKEAEGWRKFVPGIEFFATFREMQEEIAKADEVYTPQTYEQYKLAQDKLIQGAEERAKVQEEIRKTEEEMADTEKETQELNLQRLSQENEKIRHNVALMKTMGSSALDIAKYRLQALDNVKNLVTEEKYNLNLLKAQNKVAEEQMAYRKSLTDKLINQEIELMRIKGISNRELIEMKISLEEAIYGQGDQNKLLQNMLDLEKEITREKQEQNRMSSEGVELWKIAIRYGRGTAEAIGGFLRGERALSTLSERGRRIIQKRFKGRAEEAQARQYWRRDPMQPEITPQERVISRERLAERITTITPTVPIDFRNIITINIDTVKLNERILNVLRDSLSKLDIVKLIQEKVVEPY